jgi:hypothetical protein
MLEKICRLFKKTTTTEGIKKKKTSNRLKMHVCMTEIYVQWCGIMNVWYSGMKKKHPSVHEMD